MYTYFRAPGIRHFQFNFYLNNHIFWLTEIVKSFYYRSHFRGRFIRSRTFIKMISKGRSRWHYQSLLYWSFFRLGNQRMYILPIPADRPFVILFYWQYNWSIGIGKQYIYPLPMIADRRFTNSFYRPYDWCFDQCKLLIKNIFRFFQ